MKEVFPPGTYTTEAETLSWLAYSTPFNHQTNPKSNHSLQGKKTSLLDFRYHVNGPQVKPQSDAILRIVLIVARSHQRKRSLLTTCRPIALDIFPFYIIEFESGMTPNSFSSKRAILIGEQYETREFDIASKKVKT